MSEATVARDLDVLTRMATHPEQLHDMFSQTLLALRDVVPYDLAVLYALDGDTLRVRAAEGPLVNGDIRRHALPLARFPSIRRALATRQPVPLEAHHHEGQEGDPYDGILDLPPGHSCMVVPVHAHGQDLGIITLDRQTCTVYDEKSVLLAGVYGHLIGAATVYARQVGLLERYRHRLKEHNRLLQQDREGTPAPAKLEASVSPSMRRLVRLVRASAATDAPVLVTGETGTGKEVVGEAVHAWSKRADASFVTLNCASIPESLFESELFGHVKGAFSGADRHRTGRFVTADGGTLFLDEIGDMPLAQQAKLLRVLQSGQVMPVGADRSVPVDVRVIAATHVDLAKAVEDGAFREDLYYRLAVFPVHVPPLRERPEDVVAIAQSWLDGHATRTGRGPWLLTPEVEVVLREQPWPGNVRELLNVMERATILVPRGPLCTDDLVIGPAMGRPRRGAPRAASRSELETFAQNERSYLEALLERTDGRVYGAGGAAEKAGLKPTTLYSKLKKHGLR